jgi:hypothetical protein
VKLAGGSEWNVVCAIAPTGTTTRDIRVARTETNRKEDIMILVKVPAKMRGTTPAFYIPRAIGPASQSGDGLLTRDDGHFINAVNADNPE